MAGRQTFSRVTTSLRVTPTLPCRRQFFRVATNAGTSPEVWRFASKFCGPSIVWYANVLVRRQKSDNPPNTVVRRQKSSGSPNSLVCSNQLGESPNGLVQRKNFDGSPHNSVRRQKFGASPNGSARHQTVWFGAITSVCRQIFWRVARRFGSAP